uniref:Uncharacterized protein n=1 Tax=Pipistrellus kuhlii TaxID=59472 RepID=A0A7J7WDD1_PIPKU|nr:hypothetical protein mPipKuh1_008056 [Pipistrellus kuhlii]
MTGIPEHHRAGGGDETVSSKAHNKQEGQTVMGQTLGGMQVTAQEGALCGPARLLDVQNPELPSRGPCSGSRLHLLQELVLDDFEHKSLEVAWRGVLITSWLAEPKDFLVLSHHNQLWRLLIWFLGILALSPSSC